MRQIRHFYPLFGAIAVEPPDQRRLGQQIGRHVRKRVAPLGTGWGWGGRDRNFTVDEQGHAALDAEQLGLLLFFGAGLLVVAIDGNLLTNVLFEQLGGREQIVTVVLLEHVEERTLRQAVEPHRLRLNAARDVLEGELDLTRSEPQASDVAHDAEVLVVDGDRDALALGLVALLPRRRPLLGQARRHLTTDQ